MKLLWDAQKVFLMDVCRCEST